MKLYFMLVPMQNAAHTSTVANTMAQATSNEVSLLVSNTQ